MRLSFTIAATVVLMAACSPSAWGQFSSSNNGARGTTTSGLFGTSTLGGASALTTPGMQGVGSAGSNTNMGMGGMGGGGLAMPSLDMLAPVMSQQAFVGATAQNSANVRSLQGVQGGQNANGMRQGVGSNMQGIGAAGFGATSLGGRGGVGGLTNLRNAFSQQGRQNSFNNQQAQRGRQGAGGQQQIRVPIRLGFVPTPVAAPQFSANLTNRLSKTTAISAAGDISVSLEGRTAILRGTVATESDRRLAESLARLEPEVSAVQNELVVSSAETTVEVLPQAAQ